MNPAKIKAHSVWQPSSSPSGVQRDVIITLPIRTVSESNARGHWSKRAKRAKCQRLAVKLALSAVLQSEGVAAPCAVWLERIAPSAGLDDDNLRGSLKAVRDGVADALGINDRDPRVQWGYRQRRGKPREYAITMCFCVGGQVTP